MARPSLKDQRAEEILTAFARCVARFGLDGATLERISEEAGVARPAVRHFVGNREELVQALISHVEQDYTRKLDILFSWLPGQGRVQAIIDLLFDPAYFSTSDDVALAQALTAASRQYPAAGKILRRWVVSFDDRLFTELQTAFPSRKEDALRAVSFGIISLYFNVDALSPLDVPSRMADAAKSAALRLVDSLET
ncbi:MAG: TetR/AcrR family transcriptional regulator [Pseudomonadota bacterium]